MIDSLQLCIFLGKVNLPEPARLPDDEGDKFPYFFVGDEAFPLRPFLMRPYPGRALDSDDKKLYNYRLSRARRVIENCFGKFARGCVNILSLYVIDL